MQKIQTKRHPNTLCLLKRIFLSFLCIMLCLVSLSCQSKEETVETVNTQDDNYPVTGHLLYGYKHGLTIYGQYMDQAGDNNAMILVFVKEDDNCAVEVSFRSIKVNGTNVEFDVQSEEISSQIVAKQIYISSSNTGVDELCKEDYISLTLEIVDSLSKNTIEVTDPIIFSCNS